MKLPNSIRDTSIVRIGIQVDGSFNETLELTGAQLKKLAGLLGGVATAGEIVTKLVAGDAAAEHRENVPPVRVETRPSDTVVQPSPTGTKAVDTGTAHKPQTVTGDDLNAPQTTSESPSAENTNPGLPTETPDLGE